jgi:hypothetical protein
LWIGLFVGGLRGSSRAGNFPKMRQKAETKQIVDVEIRRIEDAHDLCNLLAKERH